MVHLAHALIARSQRRDPKLLQTGTASTKLPARLIDVGLNDTQSPRLVDTAGQTGFYVALSHCWGSSKKQSTGSKINRLRGTIEPSEIPRCVFDAMNLTRSLGMRYIWIDYLCVVQGDEEALSEILDIYRSAIVTIGATATISEIYDSVDYCFDGPILEQPFSIFLDWSRPTVARSFSDRLFTPNKLVDDVWYEFLSPEWCEEGQLCRDKIRALYDTIVVSQVDESGTACADIPDSDRLHGAETVQLEVALPEARFDEASREIDQGVHHVEAGKILEALAFFMKARELVSTFQALTLKSWRLHASASANVALVYRMQHLPAMALDIAEASLVVHSSLPKGECNSTFE